MAKFYIQCNDAGEHPRFWNEETWGSAVWTSMATAYATREAAEKAIVESGLGVLHVVEDSPQLQEFIEAAWGTPDKPAFNVLPIPRREVMGTKKNPGKFDCYEAAEPDEPMFTLLGRDPLAPMLVDSWANQCLDQISRGFRPGSDLAKVEEARACATAMGEFFRQRVMRGLREDQPPWRKP